jgi:hypothetical protein
MNSILFFFFADESFLTNGYLDKVVDWIPGMRDIRLRDLPSFVRTTDPNDFMFKYCLEYVLGGLLKVLQLFSILLMCWSKKF